MDKIPKARDEAADSPLDRSARSKLTKPLRTALDKAKSIHCVRIAGKGILYLKTNGIASMIEKAGLYLKGRRRVVLAKALTFAGFREMAGQLRRMEKARHGVKCYRPEVLEGYDTARGKKVLLVSHELTLTGAPMAIRYFALCLKELGYCPAIISPSDGKLAAISAEEGVPVIVYPALFRGESARGFAERFSLVVANTIVSLPVILAMNGLEIPILWWIHEAHASYLPELVARMPRILPSNVYVYAVGPRAKGVLEEYRPDYAVRELLYHIPDFSGELRNPPHCLPAAAEGKMLFAGVGALEHRKGYHILTEAILRLTPEERERCFFLFVGKRCNPPSYKAIKSLCDSFPENAAYIDELPPGELKDVYARMDCLICPSLDDPMPIVVTEALILSKPVICSEHTGSASLLRETGGAVYENDDPDALAACIRDYLNDPEKARAAGRAGRAIYDRYFSYAVYKESVRAAFAQLMREDGDEGGRNGEGPAPDGADESERQATVSVVIPTYNPGPRFETLLAGLRAQTGVPGVEIVAVDSGSTDQTIELCRRYGVRCIAIDHERFSHSYARNLGASRARGSILLFMTQDALPSGEDWLSRMIQPILCGEAGAVSCRELCPEGTDLYYKAGAFHHARYLGIADGDRLNAIGKDRRNESMDVIRPLASLNDVACAIDRKVFMRFQYRFDYAEDLDLGVRLLRSGFAIKLLGSVSVIHGHNRQAGYYLKRGYVEARSLGYIFEGWRAPHEDAGRVCRKLLYGARAIESAAVKTLEETSGACEGKAFLDRLSGHLAKAASPCREERAFPQAFVEGDETLRRCLSAAAPLEGAPFSGDGELLDHVQYYLENVMRPYLRSEGAQTLTPDLQRSVCECLKKQFALASGSALARIAEGEGLYADIQELTRGV